MTDDIEWEDIPHYELCEMVIELRAEVQRLRTEVELLDEARKSADKGIDNLLTTVKQLWVAVDALEHSLLMWQRKHPHLDLGYDALAAWQEARRG